MNLILIGAQGSGKGTQAQRLTEAYHLKPCASGELLRKAIAQGTPLGRKAQPYVERGDLVPDDLIIGLLLECIQSLDASQRGIILDGFPRNIAQARALDERLAEQREKIDWVVYLDVPREMLLDRLSDRYVCEAAEHVWNAKTHRPLVEGVCDFDNSRLYQRPDDTADKIARRLDIFFTETIRLTDYYAGKLLHVDGTGSIDDVTHAIMDAINTQSLDRAAG